MTEWSCISEFSSTSFLNHLKLIEKLSVYKTEIAGSHRPCITKYLKETILKEERFILAHIFRGFSPLSADLTELDLRKGKNITTIGECSGGSCSFHGSQEAETKEWTKMQSIRVLPQ
jgi:hypothetical protein